MRTWHPGEVAIQKHAGVSDLMAPVASQAIQDHMIAQHSHFYPKLPFAVVGAVDPQGDVWATLIAGHPGFLRVLDPKTLEIDLAVSGLDPAASGFGADDAIGILGIELETRRRNRLNGRIEQAGPNNLQVRVDESYGNCPQYIRAREYIYRRDPGTVFDGELIEFDGIHGRAADLIAQAETFFVASYLDDAGTRRVDVSHKGGRPGFVKAGADGMLTIPDFSGNLYFNTLGNILLNPRCGLVFVDFDTGDLLQITGEGHVVLDGPEIKAFQGAERLLKVRPKRIVYRPAALPCTFASREEDISPKVFLTGTWPEAESRLEASSLQNQWRDFRVVKTVPESSTVHSLYLLPADGKGLIPHRAGQHISVQVRLNDTDAYTNRSYTLSSAPSDNVYRISFKRDGQITEYFSNMQLGDIVRIRGPFGEFTIDAQSSRPAVLISAGIGVTPMISMLRHIIYEGQRTRYTRPTWFIYGARSQSERAFDDELGGLASAGGRSVAMTRALSRPDPAGSEGGDCELEGRVSIDILANVGSLAGYDFFICGPEAFAQELYDGLRRRGAKDGAIFAEAFGPSSIRRRQDPQKPPPPLDPVSSRDVEVHFVQSKARGIWAAQSGSLLDVAEALGLQPPVSCRSGSCGTCRTRLISGRVTYPVRPGTEVTDGEVLLCCAVPSQNHPDGSALLIDA